MSTPGPGDHPTLWRRLVGDADRIGWWTLPAFLAVGLAGAVMAGALAVVYYSQQVADLRSETRAARQDLQAGVDDVEEARERALDAIAEQVDAVRDALEDDLPVDPAVLGLVVVEARVNAPAPGPAAAAPGPPPAGEAMPAGAPAVRAQGQQQPTEPASPSPTPAPRPTPPPIVPRLGVGFTVAIEDGQAFVATSHGLVADPGARAGVVEEVVVTMPDGERSSGTVHSWDEARGLALVRVPGADLPIADWRPRTDVVAPGDAVTLVGLTPQGQPVAVRGTVALADVEKLVTDLPAIDFLRGAPVLDRTGRVVAVYTPAYRPFGPGAGDRQAIAPVGLFCERMLNGCESLEVEAPDRGDDQG